MNRPISLRPDFSAARREAAQALFHKAAVMYLANARRQHITDVTKAAVSPTTTSNFGVAVLSPADIPIIIAPSSAFAALAARGTTVNLSGVASVRIPGRIVTEADAGSFVAEGAPIPVRQSAFAAGPTIAPYKLACIVVMTREFAEHSSAADATSIMQSMMGEAATLKLDSTALGNGAAVTGVQPAGILNGVAAAGTATSNTTGVHLALAKDIEMLLGALAAAGAGVSPIFVTHPANAASMKTLVGPKFDYPILASVGVPAGTLIAIEASSFVTGFSGTPEFSTTNQALLHLEGATPLPIGTPGTPPTVASPSQSLYQTDTVATRMVVRCSWAMRAAGHVQYLTAVNW
jgi:HK97 family phage major capsid protein